jgi:membrane protein insertase Oxa1/YidC/SpoIIIJ
MLWSSLVDAIRVSLFVVAQWFGGSLGAAILVSSTIVRVAMIPLTLAAARAAAKAGAGARAPTLPPLNGRAVVSTVLQLTVLGAFYSAIRSLSEKAGRFLWVADLGKPDRLLAIIAAAVAATVAWLTAASTDAKTIAQIAPVVVTGALTLLFLSHMSAGLALYSVANSLVSGAERVLLSETKTLALRRLMARRRPAKR